MDQQQRGSTPEQPSDVSAAAWSEVQGQSATSEGTGAPAAAQERAVAEAQGTVGAGAPGYDPSVGESPSGSALAGGEASSSASGAESVSAGSAAGDGATGEQPRDRGHDIAQQLKPVAIAVEDITAKAVGLTTMGLTRLSAYLEKRRQAREAEGRLDPDA